MEQKKPDVLSLDEVYAWIKKQNKTLGDFKAFTIKGEEYQEAQRDADVAYYEPLIQQAYKRGLSERYFNQWGQDMTDLQIRREARQETAREIIEEIESWKYSPCGTSEQSTINTFLDKLVQSLKVSKGGTT